MARRLGWDDVRVFLAVATHGSLPRAAEAMGVSDATVSRRLGALEANVGGRLFDRSSTGHALTALGERVLPMAENMAREMDAFAMATQGADGRLEGPSVVTCPPTLMHTLVFPIVAEFSLAYPNVQLELRETAAVESLDRRVADVAFRVTNHPAAGLVGRRLVRLAYATYRRPEAPDAWVGWTERRGEAAWRAGPHAHWPVTHRSSASWGVFLAARAGLGAARIECYLGDEAPELERIDGAFFERQVWLLHHAGLRGTARVRAFVELAAKRVVAQRPRIEADATAFRREP